MAGREIGAGNQTACNDAVLQVKRVQAVGSGRGLQSAGRGTAFVGGLDAYPATPRCWMDQRSLFRECWSRTLLPGWIDSGKTHANAVPAACSRVVAAPSSWASSASASMGTNWGDGRLPGAAIEIGCQ